MLGSAGGDVKHFTCTFHADPVIAIAEWIVVLAKPSRTPIAGISRHQVAKTGTGGVRSCYPEEPMAVSRLAVPVAAILLASAGCAPALTMSTPPAPAPAPAPTTPIVQVGAPVLRDRAAEVPAEQIASDEIQRLIARMIAAMRDAPGVGLAAPQLGVPLRVLVLEDRPELMAKLGPEELRERERVEVPVRVFINPVLRPVGAETRTFFEGCLSVKGYTALVERSAEVEVRGLDERGQPHTMHVRGWPARILQHEVDHLDGTLYIDRMLSRSFSTIDQAKALYGGLPIAEVRRRLGL